MEIGSRVPNTPFFPRAANCKFTAEMLEESRKGVEMTGLKPNFVHSIFYFGQRNEAVVCDRYTFSFEANSPMPTGELYSEFRRHALAYLAQSALHSRPMPIVLVSEWGMDLLGYLIVRWLIDDRDCIFSEALRMFGDAVPGGIKYNRTLRALYNVYKHNPAQKPEFRSIHEQVISAGVPDSVLEMGIMDPEEPVLSDEQRVIIGNSVFAKRQRVRLQESMKRMTLEQVGQFDVREPVVEEVAAASADEPAQDGASGPEQQSEPVVTSPVPSHVQATNVVQVECPVLKNKRMPNFDLFGEPVERKVFARLITGLNRKLDLMNPSPPFSPTKSLDKATIEMIKEDKEHVYGLVPIPHGLKCLLSVTATGTILIADLGHRKNSGSEASPVRKVNGCLGPIHSADNEALVEGYLCFAVDGEHPLFVVSDAIIINGEDLRSKPYTERLEMAKTISLGTISDFGIDFINMYALRDFDQILFPNQEITFPVSGMYVTRPDLPSGIGGDTSLFFWLIRRVNPVVQVRFVRDIMKCVGLVQDRSSMRDVVDFGVAKPNLRALDGKCVDLKYNHDQGQWQIIGPSESAKPWTYANFNKLTDDGPHHHATPPYSYEGIRECIEDIINNDPRYR